MMDIYYNFLKNKNFDCLGIEPSKSCAEYSRAKGINVIQEFFDLNLSKNLAKKMKADLIIGK